MIRTKYVLNENLVHAARTYMDKRHTAEDIKADMDINIASGILRRDPYMDVDPWMLDARLRRQYPEITQMEQIRKTVCRNAHTAEEQDKRLQSDIEGIYANVLIKHGIISSPDELLERTVDAESLHAMGNL